MLQTKSLKLFIAVAVIGMLIVATEGFSQGYCNWDNWEQGAGTGWWNNNVPAQYTMSAEQISKINDIRVEYNEKILPLQNELRALRIEARGYSSRYNADTDKVKDDRQKIRNLEGEIEDYRLDMRNDISNQLTKEQQPYFNDGGYGWWDMDDNWWHESGNMMDSMDRCCR